MELTALSVSVTGEEVNGGAATIDLTVYWLGDLEGAHRLLLRVPSKQQKRKHPFAMYNLDQFSVMVPASEVEFDEKKQEFRFYFDSINGTFKAKLDEEMQVTTGFLPYVEDGSKEVPRENPGDGWTSVWILHGQ